MKFSTKVILTIFGAIGALAAPITTNGTSSDLTSSQFMVKRGVRAACALGRLDHSKWAMPNPGSPADYHSAYPDHSWLDFDCAFENNRPFMSNPNPGEVDQIKKAIAVAHGQTGIDKRLLLAIIMQESHGQLRVGQTTAPDYSSSSNGIMQCAGCAVAAHIPASQPVPQSIVNDMVIGGAHHFKGNMDSNGNDPYVALRAYNSGHANMVDLNDPIFATRDYVWDVVNRLRGWRN